MKSNTSSISIHRSFLIISQYYYPDITAAAFRIKETAEILNSNGHNVTVITAKPYKAVANGSEKVDDGGVKVIRVSLIKYRGKGKLNYIAHYLSFMIMAIVVSIFRVVKKNDVVFASSPPLFVGVAGYLIAKLKRSKFVLDIRDIWPDSAVVTGQLSRESKLYKWAEIIEKWLYNKAHLISCVAKPMAEYIAKSTMSNKVVVIYNGIPQRYLSSNNPENGSQHSQLAKDKINIVYVGNMGYCQDLQFVLEVAKWIRSEGIEDIKFYLVGDGVERTKLQKLRKEYDLDNVVISKPISKAEAIILLRNSSALFLQLKNDSSMEKTIPSKVFDYMLAGKPILYGIKGEGKDILEKVKGNIFFNPGSVESFVDALKELKENHDRLSEYAKENKIIVEKHYVREKMVDRLEKHIQKLFN